MTVPTKIKTWQFNLNSLQYDSTGAYRINKVAIQIKDALKGFGSSPWTVSGSSDGSTSSMDGTDRWTDKTKIVNDVPGNAHSWIVLRQAGLNTKFELCIDCSTGSYYQATFVISPGTGFGTANGGTNGSITARPTATDSYTLTQQNWGWGSGDVPGVVHCMQSTDGKCTRVVVCANGYPVNLLVFDTANNPVNSWTAPNLVFGVYSELSSVANALSYSAFNTNSSLISNANSFYVPSYLATIGHQSAPFGMNPGGLVAHQQTGEWPFTPMTLAGNGTVGYGLFGTMFDMYWGSSGLASTSNYYESGSAYSWAQFGDIILPWDGTTVKKMR